jgi:PH domain
LFLDFQKWRLRYFVLFVPPTTVDCRTSRSIGSAGRRENDGSGTGLGLCRVDSGSNPGPQLCYYDNEQLDNQHGKIDLRRCEALLTGSDCPASTTDYRYLFALRMRSGSISRTAGKDGGDSKAVGNARTYYLAAENETIMNEWTECLKESLRKFNICEGEMSPLLQYSLLFKK